MELKPIPFSKGFFASSDGKIFDSNLNEKTQYENSDNYKTASICLENNKWVTFGVHRLVALAHIKIKDPNNFTVNHRDLNKHNNQISNLEWLTVYQNNLHAALFRTKPKKPIAYIKDLNGKYEFILSMDFLSLKLNSSYIEIWDSVKNKTILNGYFIIPFTNKTLIPKELKIDKRNIPLEKRPVKILDIENDFINHFNTLHDAARAHGTSASHIFNTISNSKKVKLFKKRYLITEEDDSFPKYEKEKLDVLLGITGFQVIAFNIKTEKYEIYPSASSFIRGNKLSKKAVTTRLKKEKIEKVENYYFSYFNKKSRSRLFEILGRPGPSF